MYTLIRDEDGATEVHIHGSTSGLSPEEARRLLVGLSPVLAQLRRRAFDLPPAGPDPFPRARPEPDVGRMPLGIES